MKSILSALTMAAAVALPVTAGASELEPLQAGTFVLGEQTVSIFYTVHGDAYEVVTTIAPSNASGSPVRYVGFLKPGQEAFVSAGAFGPSAAPATLRLVHDGNALSATEVSKVMAAK